MNLQVESRDDALIVGVSGQGYLERVYQRAKDSFSKEYGGGVSENRGALKGIYEGSFKGSFIRDL